MSSRSSDDTTLNASTITIVRTSNADRVQLSLPLDTTTLNDLKHCIAKSFSSTTTTTTAAATTIPPHHQRLFHLGRELKSGGRSLRKLGVGRFRNYFIHLVVVLASSFKIRGEVVQLLDDDYDDQQMHATTTSSIGRTAAAATTTSSSSSSLTPLDVTPLEERKRTVVDLLDDSSSDDEPATSRPRVL